MGFPSVLLRQALSRSILHPFPTQVGRGFGRIICRTPIRLSSATTIFQSRIPMCTPLGNRSLHSCSKNSETTSLRDISLGYEALRKWDSSNLIQIQLQKIKDALYADDSLHTFAKALKQWHPDIQNQFLHLLLSEPQAQTKIVDALTQIPLPHHLREILSLLRKSDSSVNVECFLKIYTIQLQKDSKSWLNFSIIKDLNPELASKIIDEWLKIEGLMERFFSNGSCHGFVALILPHKGGCNFLQKKIRNEWESFSQGTHPSYTSVVLNVLNNNPLNAELIMQLFPLDMLRTDPEKSSAICRAADVNLMIKILSSIPRFSAPDIKSPYPFVQELQMLFSCTGNVSLCEQFRWLIFLYGDSFSRERFFGSLGIIFKAHFESIMRAINSSSMIPPTDLFMEMLDYSMFAKFISNLTCEKAERFLDKLIKQAAEALLLADPLNNKENNPLFEAQTLALSKLRAAFEHGDTKTIDLIACRLELTCSLATYPKNLRILFIHEMGGRHSFIGLEKQFYAYLNWMTKEEIYSVVDYIMTSIESESQKAINRGLRIAFLSRLMDSIEQDSLWWRAPGKKSGLAHLFDAFYLNHQRVLKDYFYYALQMRPFRDAFIKRAGPQAARFLD